MVYPDFSGREIVGTTDTAAPVRDRAALALDLLHLPGVVVIIGEGAMNVGDVEVVVGSNLLRWLAGVDHVLGDVMDADSSPFDSGCTTEDVLGRNDFTHYRLYEVGSQKYGVE